MSLVDPVPAGAGETWARYADAALDLATALFPTADEPDPRRSRTEALRRTLDQAREALLADDSSAFATVWRNAGAGRDSAPAVELLALLVACESDLSRAARAAALVGATRPGRLTVGGATRLLGGVRRCVEATGPGSPLRRAAYVAVDQPGAWATADLVLAPSVLWALGGDSSPDPDLPVGSWLMRGDPAAGDVSPLVLVAGPDRVRRRALAARSRAAGSWLVCPAPDTEAGWDAVVREATLCGAGVMLELDGELPAAGRRRLERAEHLPWVLSSVDELPLGDLPETPRLELTASGEVVGAEEWADALGAGTPHTHRLTAHQLELVRAARPAVGGDLDAAVRRLLAGPLARLAQRVRPRKTWDDLVLSPARTEQLRTLAARYRHAGTVYDEWGVTTASGRGIVGLLTGPPGTGKTLAAEVVAHDLELDLYRIDLSSIVSKYVGETEQNLEKVFAAASAGNAVLFFDEADSLFGKRSDVKDGRDRYANLEVSYLLQRLERYDGVVLLASNYPGNIDEAFLRRIHEVVDFVSPGVEERRAIWRRHLADGALPLGEVDVDRLAERFEITGGLIRNVVVAAAFRAADAGEPVTTAHVLPALAAELRKIGRRTKPEDFHV